MIALFAFQSQRKSVIPCVTRLQIEEDELATLLSKALSSDGKWLSEKSGALVEQQLKSRGGGSATPATALKRCRLNPIGGSQVNFKHKKL